VGDCAEACPIIAAPRELLATPELAPRDGLRDIFAYYRHRKAA